MNHFDYHHESGETELVPFTAEQIAEAEAVYAAHLAKKEAFEQKRLSDEAAKASAVAKLAALGLTEEEAEALIK